MFREFLKRVYRRIYHRFNYDVQKSLLQGGKMLAQMNRNREIKSLADAEFQVFSQRGEDGILQYIFSKIEVPCKYFVEFGVEDYTESNSRFLLMNDNWSGLVIDGSASNVRFIKSDFIYWKYDLVAVHSFITRDNINALITAHIPQSDIGLLSVDIDGNDYWVWEAIDVIKPRVVVTEYNSAFGAEQAVSVPYAADFQRSKAHYSGLYFGASLSALTSLANKKGYDLVGVAGAGVNAFFVRRDLAAPFRKYTAAEAYVQSMNRDSRDEKGKLTFLRHHERLKTMREMPVVDVLSGKNQTIKDLYQV